MRVLGLETTCDETAAAVVRLKPDGSGEILADEIMSQIAAHAAFGGVVPEIAARAHVEVLDGLIARALQKAGMQARRSRRRRGCGGSGADRRRAGRPLGGQGLRDRLRQAVPGGQPSGGACAGAAARRPAAVSLSAAARLGRPHADPRRRGRRRICPARRHDGRRHRRGVRQDRQAARPRLSRRPRGRGGGVAGRSRPLRRCPARCSAARPPISRCPASKPPCAMPRWPPRR